MEHDNYDIEVTQIKRKVTRVQEELVANIYSFGWVISCPTGGVPNEPSLKYWDWKAGKWTNSPPRHSPPMSRSQAEDLLRTQKTWLQDYEDKINANICSRVVDS